MARLFYFLLFRICQLDFFPQWLIDFFFYISLRILKRKFYKLFLTFTLGAFLLSFHRDDENNEPKNQYESLFRNNITLMVSDELILPKSLWVKSFLPTRKEKEEEKEKNRFSIIYCVYEAFVEPIRIRVPFSLDIYVRVSCHQSGIWRHIKEEEGKLYAWRICRL